jgi:hypothetical protein
MIVKNNWSLIHGRIVSGEFRHIVVLDQFRAGGMGYHFGIGILGIPWLKKISPCA